MTFASVLNNANILQATSSFHYGLLLIKKRKNNKTVVDLTEAIQRNRNKTSKPMADQKKSKKEATNQHKNIINLAEATYREENNKERPIAHDKDEKEVTSQTRENQLDLTKPKYLLDATQKTTIKHDSTHHVKVLTFWTPLLAQIRIPTALFATWNTDLSQKRCPECCYFGAMC
uniref:Ovule protein n=1 Tax=Panagrellus redivivus TaxID=6233 RepID=A0A7E4VQH6_PANRE